MPNAEHRQRRSGGASWVGRRESKLIKRWKKRGTSPRS